MSQLVCCVSYSNSVKVILLLVHSRTEKFALLVKLGYRVSQRARAVNMVKEGYLSRRTW